MLITFVAGDLDDKLKEATKSLENLKTELENKQESYKTLAMNNATEEELESAKKPLIKPIAILWTDRNPSLPSMKIWLRLIH